MSELQRFMVSSQDNEFMVVLEVDPGKLTAERATQINTFWGDHDDRVLAENGHVAKAVVRLYGARLIGLLLMGAGTHFDQTSSPERAALWSQEMHILEGWGGEDGTPHGWCGIRALAAEVVVPGFDEVELSAVRMPSTDQALPVSTIGASTRLAG